MEAHPEKYIDGKKAKHNCEKLGHTRIGEDTATRAAIFAKVGSLFKKNLFN